MLEINIRPDADENYYLLQSAIKAHLQDETDLIANFANIASFIYCTLPDVSWAGFYLVQDDVLVLGPFMGKPACTRIPFGKGVCGHVAATLQTVIIPNVHEFEGHIACDWDTNSEIVLPLFRKGKLFGVLDVDSVSFDRFKEEDVAGLSKIAAAINEYLDTLN
ncbi:MAG: GAF domain-containing protein [Defluviitaleaceae bacterium]|nr:GAF domain-containing protein [Defluviitaleaceae bacterium]